MLHTTATDPPRFLAAGLRTAALRTAAPLAAAATVALVIAGCAAPRIDPAALTPAEAASGAAAAASGQPVAGTSARPQDATVKATPDPAPRATAIAPRPAIPVRPATPVPSQPRDPAPRFLTVAGTTINMPIVEVGVSPNGAMEIPEPFEEAGWYRFGPAPGAAAGTAVVAAHVDTTSESAPFSQLKSLAPGTLVTVQRAGAPPVKFRVSRVELMAKDAFHGASVFRRDGPPLLKLVTCGGRWLDEQQNYGDNVIVTAVPA